MALDKAQLATDLRNVIETDPVACVFLPAGETTPIQVSGIQSHLSADALVARPGLVLNYRFSVWTIKADWKKVDGAVALPIADNYLTVAGVKHTVIAVETDAVDVGYRLDLGPENA